MGLSCHGSGIDPLITSVALGASLLEKSFVEDNSLLEQDVAIAENIADLPNALCRVASAWEMLGKPFRDPENVTGLIATPSRYGLVAREELAIGDILSEKNVRTAFPCKGIPVARHDEVMGWRLRRPLRPGVPIEWGDVEP